MATDDSVSDYAWQILFRVVCNEARIPDDVWYLESLQSRFPENSHQMLDLKGCDTTDETPICLNRSDLSGSNLSNANLENCEFMWSTLAKSEITNTNFNGCYMALSNLESANLAASSFQWTDLMGATFSTAKLDDASFVYCNLAGARFDNASLQRVRFGADDERHGLRCAIFDGADLTEAVLEGMDLRNVSMRNAILVNARISYCWVDEDSENEALILDGSDLTGAVLEGSTFSLDFSHVNLTDAKFIGDGGNCDVSGSQFNIGTIDGTTVDGVPLIDVIGRS